MSDIELLETRPVEALQGYREALFTVESLEIERSVAYRMLSDHLGQREFSIGNWERNRLLPAGQAMISRVSDVEQALCRATMILDAAFYVLAASDVIASRPPTDVSGSK